MAGKYISFSLMTREHLSYHNAVESTLKTTSPHIANPVACSPSCHHYNQFRPPTVLDGLEISDAVLLKDSITRASTPRPCTHPSHSHPLVLTSIRSSSLATLSCRVLNSRPHHPSATLQPSHLKSRPSRLADSYSTRTWLRSHLTGRH